MSYPALTLAIPDWVHSLIPDRLHRYERVEDRMRLAIALARANIERGGGPFGAVLFGIETHQILAPGVNLVVPSRCSVAHAEIVAIAIGQQALGHFDLGTPQGSAAAQGYELVTSSEPCAQCFGALPWSGVRALVCGARAERAEAIGFDEGPKPSGWVAELERRGIAVLRDVLADEADAVLREYADAGRTIY